MKRREESSEGRVQLSVGAEEKGRVQLFSFLVYFCLANQYIQNLVLGSRWKQTV